MLASNICNSAEEPDHPSQQFNTIHTESADIPHRQINFNDGKFMEEDPKLVEHMNECRDKIEKDKESEKIKSILTSEEFSQLVGSNNNNNIDFTKLVQDIDKLRTTFDDCTEQSFRLSGCITQILERKKPPVGFTTLDPIKCLSKIGDMMKDLSENLQVNVKTMEKFMIELNKFKKVDESFRNKLIELLKCNDSQKKE